MSEEKRGDEGAEMGPVCGVCHSSDDTVLAYLTRGPRLPLRLESTPSRPPWADTRTIPGREMAEKFEISGVLF